VCVCVYCARCHSVRCQLVVIVPRCMHSVTRSVSSHHGSRRPQYFHRVKLKNIGNCMHSLLFDECFTCCLRLLLDYFHSILPSSLWFKNRTPEVMHILSYCVFQRPRLAFKVMHEMQAYSVIFPYSYAASNEISADSGLLHGLIDILISAPVPSFDHHKFMTLNIAFIFNMLTLSITCFFCGS